MPALRPALSQRAVLPDVVHPLFFGCCLSCQESSYVFHDSTSIFNVREGKRERVDKREAIGDSHAKMGIRMRKRLTESSYLEAILYEA